MRKVCGITFQVSALSLVDPVEKVMTVYAAAVLSVAASDSISRAAVPADFSFKALPSTVLCVSH